MPLKVPNGSGAAYVGRRALRRCLLVVVPAGVIGSVVNFYAGPLPGLDFLLRPTVGAILIACVYFLFVGIEAVRLRKLGFHVCTHCGYHLRGLPETGTCPECGQPFDTKSVRNEWNRRTS
jgi:hypothetical protein